MVMNCAEVLTQVSNYLEEDLDPGLRRAIEKHFAQCRKCSSVLAGMRNVVAVCGDEKMFSLPVGFHSRLRRHLEDKVETQRGSWQGWLITLVTSGALAALVLFATVQDRFVPEPRAKMSQPARRMSPQLVAVVDGGKTFHVPGCPYMHGRYRMVTANEAVREGYTPCDRCMSELLRSAENAESDSKGLEVASKEAAN